MSWPLSSVLRVTYVESVVPVVPDVLPTSVGTVATWPTSSLISKCLSSFTLGSALLWFCQFVFNLLQAPVSLSISFYCLSSILLMHTLGLF